VRRADRLRPAPTATIYNPYEKRSQVYIRSWDRQYERHLQGVGNSQNIFYRKRRRQRSLRRRCAMTRMVQPPQPRQLPLPAVVMMKSLAADQADAAHLHGFRTAWARPQLPRAIKPVPSAVRKPRGGDGCPARLHLSNAAGTADPAQTDATEVPPPHCPRQLPLPGHIKSRFKPVDMTKQVRDRPGEAKP